MSEIKGPVATPEVLKAVKNWSDNIPEPNSAAPAPKEIIKTLSEISLLKAKVHQLSLIDALKTDDLYRAQRQLKQLQLQEQGLALEAEFRAETEETVPFDWNTLTFKK